MDPKTIRRAVRLLAVGQAALWATIFLSVFLGPFAVKEMTGTFALGGLPIAMYSVSQLLVILPAGRLMDRVGRAPVLALGHGVGAGGALTVAVGLALNASGNSLAVVFFLAGLFLLSAGSSIALLTRVAAADLYPTETRAWGLGRFLIFSFAGSLLGAIAFLLLSPTGAPSVPVGYLAMVPLFCAGIVAMVVVRGLLPRPSTAVPAARGLRRALRNRGVGLTIASNAGANAGMAGVMSLASPALSGLGGLATGGIMLAHFGGMFLPSPFAGRLADREGRALSILVGGAILVLGCLLFQNTSVGVLAGLGLFLVGAGWCFTFIPGTALLADATRFEQRGLVFGANDTITSVVSAGSVLFAGFAFAEWGIVGLTVLGAAYGLLPVAAGARLRRAPAAAPIGA